MDNARIWGTGQGEREAGFWPTAGRFIRERFIVQQSWRALNLLFLCDRHQIRARASP
jgi:hypothetical protein